MQLLKARLNAASVWDARTAPMPTPPAAAPTAAPRPALPSAAPSAAPPAAPTSPPVTAPRAASLVVLPETCRASCRHCSVSLYRNSLRWLPNVSTVGLHGCCVTHPVQSNTRPVLAISNPFIAYPPHAFPPSAIVARSPSGPEKSSRGLYAPKGALRKLFENA